MTEFVLADQAADWHRLKALVLDSVSSPITRRVYSLGLRSDNEFTRILSWPGYRVYQHEIDEKAKTLKLWVRRKRGNRKIECSGCGRKFVEAYDIRGRPVRDLPWGEYQTTVFVEIYRVRCPDCGVKTEKVPQLPSKAPFSKRFEEAVGLACESAAARQVARQFGLSASTVRAIDLRYLEGWAAGRRVHPAGWRPCVLSGQSGELPHFSEGKRAKGAHAALRR